MESENPRLNDIDWLTQQYIIKKRTASDIANELGVHYSTVRRAIARNGVKNRGKLLHPELYDKTWLTKQLEKKTLNQIAKDLGSSVGNVHYRAKQLGITPNTVNRSLAVRQALKKKYPEGRFGENASNWKGGRRLFRGYVAIYTPDHPHNRGGYVFEHRLMAEKKIGRFLDSNEIVRHINGNKQDNSPNNLEVVGLHQNHSKYDSNSKDLQSLAGNIEYSQVELMQTNFDIDSLIKEKSGIRLDIGGGAHPQPGFVNIDILPLKEVDIVWDLENTPWPLPDECVLTAIASHVLEHIDPHKGVFINVMNEIWRVLKPGAQFAFVVPHGESAGYIQDPTHCNPMNETTMHYFDPDPEHSNIGPVLYQFYRPKPWKIEKQYFSPQGNLEVLLTKRKIDKSYLNETFITDITKERR